ncbi:MAG: hypothetical protein WCD53_20515 [Microcoleus sp.]
MRSPLIPPHPSVFICGKKKCDRPYDKKRDRLDVKEVRSLFILKP